MISIRNLLRNFEFCIEYFFLGKGKKYQDNVRFTMNTRKLRMTWSLGVPKISDYLGIPPSYMDPSKQIDRELKILAL